MAMRSTWKGAISIGIVGVPVKVYPAQNSSEKISFNQLHKGCHAPIKQKLVCSACDKTVERADLEKGYQFEKGKYVVMSEDELDNLRVESMKKIDLTTFTSREILDPARIDQTYFLAPDGPLAADAYATVRDAMGDRVGIGKVAVRNREYFVAIAVEDKGFRMYTMLPSAEVRTIDMVEELRTLREPNPQMVEMMSQLIERLEGDVDLNDFRDDYNEGVKQLIDAKLSGKVVPITAAPKAAPASSLMDALRASLESVPSKAKTAKAATSAPAKKAKKAS